MTKSILTTYDTTITQPKNQGLEPSGDPDRAGHHRYIAPLGTAQSDALDFQGQKH